MLNLMRNGVRRSRWEMGSARSRSAKRVVGRGAVHCKKRPINLAQTVWIQRTSERDHPVADGWQGRRRERGDVEIAPKPRMTG